MSGEHVWLRHPKTGGYFHCPAEAVGDWLDMGWERSDAPAAEPSPVVAEHLAWRAKQAEQIKPTKAARRGETTGDVSNG
jgi:hypothetical protein